MAAAVREEVKATKTATVDEALMMVATEAMAGVVQGPMEVVATAAEVMKTMTSNGRHLRAKQPSKAFPTPLARSERPGERSWNNRGTMGRIQLGHTQERVNLV